MKKILMVFTSILTMLSLVSPIYATDNNSGLKWKINTVSKDGVEYNLDMTEKELNAYIINKLKEQFEKSMPRTSGYVYDYKKVKTIYSSGDEATQKILIGKYLTWAQRSSVTVAKTVSFTLKGSYKTITGEASLSMSTEEKYTLNNNYDNCLGLFAKLETTKYSVTKKDAYTGSVVSVSYINVMTPVGKAVRPIYNKSSNTISYSYSSKWYTAKMIKTSVTSPVTSDSQFTTATTNVFN